MNLKIRIVIIAVFLAVLFAFLKYLHFTRTDVPDTRPQALAFKYLPADTAACVYFDIVAARKQPSLTPLLNTFEGFAVKFEKFFSDTKNPYGAELQCAFTAFFYNNKKFDNCWFLFTKYVLDENKTIQDLIQRNIAITTRERRNTKIYSAEDTEAKQNVSFFFLSPKVIAISEKFETLYRCVDTMIQETSYFDTFAGTQLKHSINRDNITCAAAFSLNSNAKEMLMREPRFSAFSTTSIVRIDIAVTKFFEATIEVFCDNAGGAKNSLSVVKELISFSDSLSSVYPLLSYLKNMKTVLKGSSFSLNLWLPENDTNELITIAAQTFAKKTPEENKPLEITDNPVYNTDSSETAVQGD